MNRNRLLGFLTASMLGLCVSPAAALGTAAELTQEQVPLEIAEIAEVVTAQAVAVAASQDPEIDETIEGVGHLMVDIDQENQTLTVGVGVDALGIDETITLPPASGGGEQEAGFEGTASAEQVAEADAKADMADVKDAAASDVAATPRPAFARADEVADASGSVASGTGVTGSTRPAPAPASAGDNAAGSLADGVNSPILRILALMMLAGTGTVWSIARRMGLA